MVRNQQLSNGQIGDHGRASALRQRLSEERSRPDGRSRLDDPRGKDHDSIKSQDSNVYPVLERNEALSFVQLQSEGRNISQTDGHIPNQQGNNEMRVTESHLPMQKTNGTRRFQDLPLRPSKTNMVETSGSYNPLGIDHAVPDATRNQPSTSQICPSLSVQLDGNASETLDTEPANPGHLSKVQIESTVSTTGAGSIRALPNNYDQSAQSSTLPVRAIPRQSHKQYYNLRPRKQDGMVKNASQRENHLVSLQSHQTILPIKKPKRPIAKGPGLTLKIPVPTADYLNQALQSPRKAFQSQALLIVIDLNGTLLCRTNTKSSFRARKKVGPFLDYLLKHHHVMIWSSSMPKNVDNMVKKLFNEEQRELLVAQWARDTLRLTPKQLGNKVQVYKQLSWIWAVDANVKHPNGIAWDQTNTVLIDDSVAKAAAEPFNLLEVPEFEGMPEETDVLDQALGYIEWLKDHVDVSSAIQSRPFKVDEWKLNEGGN